MDTSMANHRFPRISYLVAWLAIVCSAPIAYGRAEAADDTTAAIQSCKASKDEAKSYLSNKGIETHDANAEDLHGDTQYNPADCTAPSWRASFAEIPDYEEEKVKLVSLCKEAGGTLSTTSGTHPVETVVATCNLQTLAPMPVLASPASVTKTPVQACRETADKAEVALRRWDGGTSSKRDSPDSNRCFPLNWKLIVYNLGEDAEYTKSDRQRIDEICKKAGGVLTDLDEEDPDVMCSFKTYAR